MSTCAPNVLGLVAICIALSASAIALPGRNTVRSDDIKNGAVASPDVGDGALRGIDVLDDTLRGADVSNADGGTLGGADIRESSLGPVPAATNATNAANAANAANADTLDSLDSTAFGYGITSVSYNPNEAATEYMPGLGASFGPASATESDVDLMTARDALVARDLRVQVNSVPGPNNAWTITLREDGADTGLSCSISGTVFTTVCTDSGPSSTIGSGSLLSLEVTPVSGPNPAAAMDIAFRYGPA